jgi:hypothetical protein
MTAGVVPKSTTKIPIRYRKKRLKIKRPLVPFMFFHKISEGVVSLDITKIEFLYTSDTD